MSIYRMDVFTSRRANSNANVFVGEAGRLFYDQDVPVLRLSDGVTPWWLIFTGGGSSGNVNQLLAGNNIILSPSSGVGIVEISAIGGGSQGPQGFQGKQAHKETKAIRETKTIREIREYQGTTGYTGK